MFNIIINNLIYLL